MIHTTGPGGTLDSGDRDLGRTDGAVFQALIASPEARERLAHLTGRGLQTPGPLERDLGRAVAEFNR
ncbi:hypothetical protein [Streptomyces parvulus]|uniref:hypothetical protein n=1 Tax=Streptomyces parvulus TaxID=146923 RepID=UPI0033D1342C